MYIAKIENSGGEVLILTQDESRWTVYEITGLNPPGAQINLTNLAGLDGARFNSSKLATRNIVVSLKINGEIETNRQELYRFFRTKEACIFYFANANRNVKIAGYVETVECNMFSNMEIMQISIICPYPYFQAVEESETDISNQIRLFVFPFSINEGEPVPFSEYTNNRIAVVENGSEAETGAVFEVEFTDNVSKLMIYNTERNEHITINYNFHDGDRAIISTVKGQKSATLIRNGISRNIFSAVERGSVFLQLLPGENRFSYVADDGASNDDVHITVMFSEIFRGV